MNGVTVPDEGKPGAEGGWFFANDFGDPDRLSPGYDDMLARAVDVVTRPDDEHAHDRFEIELQDMARFVTLITPAEQSHDYLACFLRLLLLDTARRTMTGDTL